MSELKTNHSETKGHSEKKGHSEENGHSEKKSRSELKREAIIEAAKRAFQEHGVQGTSMDLIAELAQVSKRTVYNHFATKEVLVSFLVAELWRMAMMDIDQSYETGTPLQSQLESILKAEIDTIAGTEYVELSRVAFGHYLYRSEDLLEALERFNDQETVLLRWLLAAKQDGRLVPDMDVDFAFQQLHGLVKAGCFWPQFIGSAQILDETARQRLAQETAAMFIARYERRPNSAGSTS